MHERQAEAVRLVTDSLRRDRAVRAVFLKGSIARGTDDHLSDVDLYCLIRRGKLDSFLDRRLQHVRHYRPVIYHSESHFVAPQLVVVFDDRLHLDLYATTREDLTHTDEIRILHDPENLLQDYRPRTPSLTPAGVARAFNIFSFSLLEYEVACRRGDELWATRLAGHLAADVGRLLRHLHQPEWGQLGIKGLAEHLPRTRRQKLHVACSALGPDDHPSGVQSLVQLASDILDELPPAVRDEIFTDLFARNAEAIRALD